MKNHPPSLTEGSILKSLIRLSLPIIAANLLQTAYQLIDTFWIGRLGNIAVAAVSVSFPIVFLIVSLGMGLAMAGTILIAQYKGQNNKRMQDHITGQTFLMVFFISIILAMIGYACAPILIKFMGTSPEVFVNAVSYIRISFIGMIFVFLFMVFQTLMRGVGDVKTPMYIVLGTVILNLILDPFFIFGYGIIPPLNIVGAAVATIITQGIAAIIGLIFLFRGKHQIQLYLKDLRPNKKLLFKMIQLGLPISIEHSTRATGMIAMLFLVTTFGTLNLAAYGIGTSILSFIIIPALGLAMATSTLIGQNIGAGKIERAETTVKMSCYVAFISLTIVGIFLFIFAQQISTLFLPNELDTVKVSALFIKIMSLSFGFLGVQMALNGAFRGSGNTMLSMFLSIISLWILRFPIAWILSYYTSLAEIGLWISFPAANLLGAIITIIWFARGSWKNKKITEDISL